MPSFTRAVVLALGLASCAKAINIELLADINRDGKIDDQDADLKQAKPPKRALFLANIGDTNRRCQIMKTQDEQMTSAQLEKCNDAEGFELRNPNYVAHVRTKPCLGLGKRAYGHVFSDNQDHVRIFHNIGHDWIHVDKDYPFTAEQLENGLNLGIDSRDVRQPAWDGNTKLTVQVYDNEAKVAEDFIHFEVAPVLTHHVLQAPDQVFTMGGLDEFKDQENFVGDIVEFTKFAGVTKLVHIFKPNEDFSTKNNRGQDVFNQDFWAQDFFKPGYTSMPGPNGITSLRVMITSAQEKPFLHQQVFADLRSAVVGAVRPAGFGGTLDSLGNLDTIPPFEFKGKSYPAGMPVMGTDGKDKPFMLQFLENQGTPALELDSGWLLTKHVDEFMQFLPDLTGNRGWIMAVNDPMAGLELLKDAVKNGHGQFNAFSRRRQPDDYVPPGEASAVNAKPAASTDGSVSDSDSGSENGNRGHGNTRGYSSDPGEANDRDYSSDRGYSSDPGASRNRGFFGNDDGSNDDGSNDDGSNDSGPLLDTRTIEELLATPHFEEFNKFCAKRIRDNIKRMKDKTGISDDRIIRIPVLYRPVQDQDTPSGEDMAGATEIDNEPENPEVKHLKATSLFPNAINGLVYANGKYLAPFPWGPKIVEKDILALAVEQVYKNAGFEIHFIDDWSSHHSLGGDIHCGTNMARDASQQWWQPVEATA